MRRIRVAIIGAGPAGIYAADVLTKEYDGARVDIFDQLPAPYGLVRDGVAPDHPRIKEIIKALQRVLSRDEIRFIGNVRYGFDIKLSCGTSTTPSSSAPARGPTARWRYPGSICRAAMAPPTSSRGTTVTPMRRGTGH